MGHGHAACAVAAVAAYRKMTRFNMERTTMGYLKSIPQAWAGVVRTGAAVAFGALVVLATQTLMAPRVTSAESHAVWNFIVANELDSQLAAEFDSVNSAWPPTKAELGQVALSAVQAVAGRQQSLASGR